MSFVRIYSLIAAFFVLVLSFILGSHYFLSNEINELRRVVAADLNTLNNRIGNSGAEEAPVATPLETPEYGQLIRVARVIDGDTIQLENGERLRYIGINTPEKNDPRKPVQCFAEQASEKNKELVEGKQIKFYKDVTERDKYQRLLGYVYLEDGTFVNLEMVKTGYAFSYTYSPDISKQDEFTEAQELARTQKLGLWSGCQVTENTSGRLETNPISD
ncbi:MAG: thermonuclease family protein [Candidatus Veblenbacteria bacterium]|nr:thermonuclease family protein [Candidatus Veblenbacteria bacterium]